MGWRLSIVGCLLVLAVGCASADEWGEMATEGSALGEGGTPPIPTLLDEMAVFGSYIEDFLWHGGYGVCDDCGLVVRADYSVPGEMTQHIYVHKRGPKGSHHDREMCTARWAIQALPVPGYDPSDRIFLDSYLIENTCGWPVGQFPPCVLARVRSSATGAPDLVAWWPGDDPEGFPGWDWQGTHMQGTPLTPCPESEYISHKRPYCRPGCDLKNPRKCHYPEPD